MRPVILCLLFLPLWSHAAECTTVPGNPVPGCGFADAIEAAEWAQVGNGDSYTFSMGDGNPPGSGEIDGQDLSTFFRATLSSGCFPIMDNAQYTFGADVTLVSGTAPECLIRMNAYQAADCVTFSSQELPDSDSPTTPQPGVWSTAQATDFVSGNGGETVTSGSLVVVCDGPDDFVVRIDNGIVNEGTTLPVELQNYTVE